MFLCNYANFTMAGIFDLLDKILHTDPSVLLHAEFDLQYGFISALEYGVFLSHGLFNPRISDTNNHFSVTNFQPLEE